MGGSWSKSAQVELALERLHPVVPRDGGKGVSAGRILIIKLSALGDFIQASGAMEAVVRAHPGARFTLLTTPPYEALGRATGFFEAIWTDGRPSGAAGLARLVWRIRRARFDRVYDLQGSSRTDSYFQLLRPRPPEWCGTAWGAAFRHPQPVRQERHIQEVLAEQLALAGVGDIPRPHLSWLKSDVARFGLPDAYVLLAPGGAPHRPQKRWPASAFGALAQHLDAAGLTPAVLGRGAEEAALAETILAAAPGARSLVDQTSFADIASLGRGARAAIGNDTGPMHVAATAGAPALVLFSADSDPATSAPRPWREGQRIETLKVDDLQSLSVEAVAERLRADLEIDL
jgi:ADP-heptose:LPS heptosyltransferase